MRLPSTETDKASLSSFGSDVLTLLEAGQYRTLADRFSYALAFGEDPAVAIEKEIRRCLAEFQTLPERRVSVHPSITVKYFKPGDSPFFALVECVWITAEGCPLLVELIVTSVSSTKHITLEQISLIAA